MTICYGAKFGTFVSKRRRAALHISFRGLLSSIILLRKKGQASSGFCTAFKKVDLPSEKFTTQVAHEDAMHGAS